MSEKMEAAKGHIPGPWKHSPVSSVVGSLVSYGDISKGETICAVVPQRDKAVTEANARLIAQAPKMAELLKSWRDAEGMEDGGFAFARKVKAVLREAGVL